MRSPGQARHPAACRPGRVWVRSALWPSRPSRHRWRSSHAVATLRPALGLCRDRPRPGQAAALEDLEAGPARHSPSAADGNRILWTEARRTSDNEMRGLMRHIFNRLYTFHWCVDAPGLQADIERWMALAGKWDEPEIDLWMVERADSERCLFRIIIVFRRGTPVWARAPLASNRYAAILALSAQPPALPAYFP